MSRVLMAPSGSPQGQMLIAARNRKRRQVIGLRGPFERGGGEERKDRAAGRSERATSSLARRSDRPAGVSPASEGCGLVIALQ